MKRLSLPLRVGTALGACAMPLQAQGPVLATPGTATWETHPTPTGSQTVFTISDNSVFNWSAFNLSGGSELVFDFVGGTSVVNYLNGSSPSVIGGTVTSNGSVGFFALNGDLIVNGGITAGSVTLATADVDAAAFASGSYQLGASGGWLTINGSVTATSGDVVLAGKFINVTGSAQIEAAGAVRMGAADHVSVGGDGDRRLSGLSGDGYILHLGTTHAATIEMTAGKAISTRGELGIQNGRLFFEVGPGGTVRNEAMIIDDVVFDGTIQTAIDLEWNDGDAAAAVGDASLPIPKLTRPNGSRVSDAQVITYSAPMSASSDAARDSRRQAERKVVKRESSPSMLQLNSFFGMRGGSVQRSR